MHRNLQPTQNRSMEEDLKAMMCADALGIAKSTINSLTAFHGNASRIYSPSDCRGGMLKKLAKIHPKVQVGSAYHERALLLHFLST